MAELLGWHFMRKDRRLGWGDGREVKVGETLTVEGPLVMCEHGLHASVRALDALKYAPGPIACRVRLSGEVLQPSVGADSDKVCATERTVIAMVDATDLLREFIRDTLVFRQPHMVRLFEKAGLLEHAEALRALEMETAAWGGIEAVCNAATDAAWGAATYPARDAAWDAVRSAAWDAARSAAWDAARSVAWDATWDAVEAAARDATRAATWDAVEAAARMPRGCRVGCREGCRDGYPQ